MDHEECYVFTLDVHKTQPARKRRKKGRSDTFNAQKTPFSALMKGLENDKSVEYRFKIFQELWLPQEEALRGYIDDANTKTIEAVKSFVLSTSEEDHGPDIPAGLIVQGPENNTFTGLYDVLCNKLAGLDHSMCIKLTAGQSPNLKTILRYVNQAATPPVDEQDYYNRRTSNNLTYDLQTLHLRTKRESLRHVVLLFEDSEAFDGSLLSDLIDLLNLWNDRVPFVLLFGIATSIEIFHKKLSPNATKCLDGKKFEMQPIDIDCMFNIVHSGSSRVFLGEGLSKVIIERQRSLVSNAESFVQLLKYAYMAHTFSNPLSIWLGSLPESCPFDQENLQVIRHLPSFRRCLQQLVDDGQYEAARKLFDDDTELHKFVCSGAHNSLKALKELKLSVDILFAIRKILHSHDGSAHTTWSELYILAISDQLLESDLLKDTLDKLKKLNSSALQECLELFLQETSARDDPNLGIADAARELTNLMAGTSDHLLLRSAHEIQLGNTRASIVAKKVELGRSAAKVTEEESSYTKVVENLVSKVGAFFGSHLLDPQNIFLLEVFLYDVKNLHREVFMPRPRFSIERALSSPHDYLGCACCNNSFRGLSASHPAVALLYQLYLESGNVINIADLWIAFWTIVGPEESEHEDDEREEVLALFSKALAELKYLGLVKNSRKKVDHLVKLLWQGL